ncbi:hypothetical protein RUM43_004700 [Polyplax serrata]|uniref:Uncharacterized protein n=1 Tax=Polyplax serrata TaxID=468196 RepID=A0AAN8XQC8_POLSC
MTKEFISIEFNITQRMNYNTMVEEVSSWGEKEVSGGQKRKIVWVLRPLRTSIFVRFEILAIQRISSEGEKQKKKLKGMSNRDKAGKSN